MTAIVTIGIDLAKSAFVVHGEDGIGKLALMRPSAHRAKLYRVRMSESALSAMSSRWAKLTAVAQRLNEAAPRSGVGLNKLLGLHCLDIGKQVASK